MNSPMLPDLQCAWLLLALCASLSGVSPSSLLVQLLLLPGCEPLQRLCRPSIGRGAGLPEK